MKHTCSKVIIYQRTLSDMKIILLGCSEYTVNTIFMLSYRKRFCWQLLPENAICDIVSSMWSTYRNVHILHFLWCIYSHNLHIDTFTILYISAQKVNVNIAYLLFVEENLFIVDMSYTLFHWNSYINGGFCKGCITRRVNRTPEICHIIILLRHCALIKIKVIKNLMFLSCSE